MKGWFYFIEPPIEIVVHTEIEDDLAYRMRLLLIIPIEGLGLLASTGEKLDEVGKSVRCYRKHWYRTEAKK